MRPDLRDSALRSVNTIDDLLNDVDRERATFAETFASLRQHVRALRALVQVDVSRPVGSDAVDLARRNLVAACTRYRTAWQGGLPVSDQLVYRDAVFEALSVLRVAEQVSEPAAAEPEQVSESEARLRAVLSVCEAYLEHVGSSCETCKGGHPADCREQRVLWSVAYEALPIDLEPFDLERREPITGQPAR